MMKTFGDKTIWLVTGSQHLYGPRVLEQVRDFREYRIEGRCQDARGDSHGLPAG